MLLRVFCLLLFVLTTTIRAPAQSAPEVYGDNDVWFLLLNKTDVSDRWSLFNEVHLRRHQWLAQQEQFLLRPAVNYAFNEAVVATVGYTYIRTGQYGQYPLPVDVPENNVWEQITLSHNITKQVAIHHRYRIEHRWIGAIAQNGLAPPGIDGTRFTQRFRYRLTANFPIVETEAGTRLYGHVFDELWVNLRDELHVMNFDRNWIYLGLGYRFSPETRLEVAFLDQWINHPAANRYEHNPTVQFTFAHDIDLRQSAK
jgi:hypothetical protein